MATVRDIFAQMDQWAPFETQMDFDNAGFLVGRGEREVRKILVSAGHYGAGSGRGGGVGS